MILRIYISHKLDSFQGKLYKKHVEVTINLRYLTHKELQFPKSFSRTLLFSWDLNHQKVPAAYAPHVLVLFYYFLYNCPNVSEIYQLWKLHIVDHKLYKTTNKLNTCHYSLNGDLLVFLFSLERIKSVSFVDV